MRLAGRLRAHQHRRGAIDNARRIAGMMDMVDTFDLRVALQRHVVKAHRAELLECGFKLRQPLQRGLRLDELVVVQDGLAHGIEHRHQRA